MPPVFTLPPTLAEREQRLMLARTELKKKFIGIDEQIDSIIDRIMYWYLRQDQPRRPVIVNLWGTTGVGKTDLIRDLKGILGYSDRYSEIMLSDNEGEHLIVDHIYENCSELADGQAGFIVLDEFQRYKTKESNGEAKRGMGYKDVWQILSDGLILKNISRYTLGGLFNTFGWYPKTGFDGLDEDGDLPDDEDTAKNLIKVKTAQLRWGANASVASQFNYREPKGSLLMNHYYAMNPERLQDLKKEFQDASRLIQNRGYKCDGTVEGTLECLAQLLDEGSSDQFTLSHDFRNTVIFVIGNLDDVYKKALKSDSSFIPADYYREWSRDISIFDIKDSLKDLFFPEQVARLGNTHIIYPTLGESHYRDLIVRGMQYVIEDVTQGGYRVRIMDSLVEFVYRNAVYPTQGVRPVFSTIQDVSNSVMIALQSLPVLPQEQEYLLSYDMDSRAILVCLGDKVISSYNFIGDRDKEMDKLLSNEGAVRQYSTHEIGHALTHYVTAGRVPQFCVITDNGAQTVDTHHMAFTFEVQWANVVASMGGIAATEVLYSKNIVSGHTRDLQEATSTLVEMIRTYGFGDLLLKKISPVSYWLGKPFRNTRPLSCKYTVLGDKTAEADEVILYNNSDYYLVDKALRKAHKEALAIITSYPMAVEAMVEELAQKQFIDHGTMQKCFERFGVTKGTPETFLQQGE